MSLIFDPLVDIALCHYSHMGVMSVSHIHPQYELFFCTEDVEQRSVINGVEYNNHHPCIIISSPYTIHSMSICQPYDRYVIYFTDSILETFTERHICRELCRTNIGLLFNLTTEQAADLKAFIDAADPKTEEETELMLALLLKKLLACCPIEDAIKFGTSSFYIQDVLQYIAESLQDRITADDVAYKFSVSRSKLDRDFKRFTGGTLHNFIDNCRLNQSKSLLKRQSDLSIADVAKQSGFINEAYFFSYFKKHTGKTPTEYRREMQIQNSSKLLVQ